MRHIIRPRIIVTLLLAALLPMTAVAALPAAVDGKELPSLAPVLERVTPSVVNVYTRTRVQVRSPLMEDPFFRRFFNLPNRSRERVSQSLGSGVIVDAKDEAAERFCEGYEFHLLAGAGAYRRRLFLPLSTLAAAGT